VVKRGTDWEEQIEAALQDVTMRGVKHTVVKTEAPVRMIRHVQGAQFLGVYTAPGMCDFEGGWPVTNGGRGSVPVCLEAKETAQLRLNHYDGKTIKTNQVIRLDQTLDMGGIAGALVRYRPVNTLPQCWGIPWTVRDTLMEDEVKSFKMGELRELGCMKFASPVGPSAQELIDFMDLCLVVGERFRGL
jgi:hypothetical protein